MKSSASSIVNCFKIGLSLFFLMAFSAVIAQPAATQSKYKIKTVFIDPGHGGTDPGCHGVYSKEADVALKISLMVGKYINMNYPDVKVVFARTTDQFVDLYERAVMANKANADLFICIHCNASTNHSAYGTETYTMGLHRTDDNFQVAKRENAVILMENDYQSHYEGFDPNDPASYIMFSMLQNANLDQSVNIASKIQDQFEDYGRFNRGVNQAGFAVLVHTSMPSILVETGFLTNPTEEKFMTSDSGLTILSACIYNGFAEYKVEMEKLKGVAKLVKPKFNTSVDNTLRNKSTITTNVNNEPTVTNDPAPEKPLNNPAPKAPDFYSVQFYVSPTPLNLDDSRLKNVGKFTIEQDGQGRYHYMSEKLPDSMSALKTQNEFRKLGFADAFMVLYKEGKRQPTGNVGDY